MIIFNFIHWEKKCCADWYCNINFRSINYCIAFEKYNTAIDVFLYVFLQCLCLRHTLNLQQQNINKHKQLLSSHLAPRHKRYNAKKKKNIGHGVNIDIIRSADGSEQGGAVTGLCSVLSDLSQSAHVWIQSSSWRNSLTVLSIGLWPLTPGTSGLLVQFVHDSLLGHGVEGVAVCGGGWSRSTLVATRSASWSEHWLLVNRGILIHIGKFCTG